MRFKDKGRRLYSPVSSDLRIPLKPASYLTLQYSQLPPSPAGDTDALSAVRPALPEGSRLHNPWIAADLEEQRE
ncbi:MAG TPA: hypothetical protein VF605_08575 [Allosphingosinicella sp.]|jgi:hypothetical protein